MLRYVVVVLLAVAGVSHALSDAEKAVKPKSVCEKKASDCLSFPNSFKCAMMLKRDMTLPNRELIKRFKAKEPLGVSILDIIPDLINQPGVNVTDEIQEELDKREINFPAFDIADVCGNKITARKRSNARCYAFLQDYADEPIDSCETGLITSDGEEVTAGTVGDALCERAYNIKFPDEGVRKKWEKRDWKLWDVTIGAYHSYCGTDWQEVATGSGKTRKTLDLKRRICCSKPKNPKCKNGKITGNAPPLAAGETCEVHAIRLTCDCPTADQLPLKPKYGLCTPPSPSEDIPRDPIPYNFSKGKGEGCEEKKK